MAQLSQKRRVGVYEIEKRLTFKPIGAILVTR